MQKQWQVFQNVVGFVGSLDMHFLHKINYYLKPLNHNKFEISSTLYIQYKYCHYYFYLVFLVTIDSFREDDPIVSPSLLQQR